MMTMAQCTGNKGRLFHVPKYASLVGIADALECSVKDLILEE